MISSISVLGILGFVLGAIVGSFLFVVAHRFDTNDSALVGRSHCPHCRRTLTWWELFPLLSYLVLRGRCRTCGAGISWQYPAVEFVTAVGTALIIGQGGDWLTSALYLVVWWSSVVIILVDLAHMLIPDLAVVLIGLVAAGLHSLAGTPLDQVVSGALVGGGFPAVLVLVTRGRGMGWGDVKLGGALGLLLGYPLAGVGLFLAITSGAVVGVALIGLRIRKLRDALPFGPFLLLGGFLAMLWGEQLLAWYLGLSRIG